MSASNDGPRGSRASATVSTSFADLLVPGVVVEMDAREADDFGAFEETALSEPEAWDTNAALDPDEARDGA
jgi:hypothetical protein